MCDGLPPVRDDLPQSAAHPERSRSCCRHARTLTDADGDTDVLGVHDGLPPGGPPGGDAAGWRSSLAKLAALVEA